MEAKNAIHFRSSVPDPTEVLEIQFQAEMALLTDAITKKHSPCSLEDGSIPATGCCTKDTIFQCFFRLVQVFMRRVQ